jgi:hypothetical protein
MAKLLHPGKWGRSASKYGTGSTVQKQGAMSQIAGHYKDAEGTVHPKMSVDEWRQGKHQTESIGGFSLSNTHHTVGNFGGGSIIGKKIAAAEKDAALLARQKAARDKARRIVTDKSADVIPDKPSIDRTRTQAKSYGSSSNWKTTDAGYQGFPENAR